MCHDKKEWYKMEEELTCHFKTEFDSSTQKPKTNCSLIGSFDQSICLR